MNYFFASNNNNPQKLLEFDDFLPISNNKNIIEYSENIFYHLLIDDIFYKYNHNRFVTKCLDNSFSQLGPILYYSSKSNKLLVDIYASLQDDFFNIYYKEYHYKWFFGDNIVYGPNKKILHFFNKKPYFIYDF